MKKLKVGQKVKLTVVPGLYSYGLSIKTYSAKITRVTGVAVEVEYRNQYGTHHQWLNRKLELNGYPNSSFNGVLA